MSATDHLKPAAAGVEDAPPAAASNLPPAVRAKSTASRWSRIDPKLSPYLYVAPFFIIFAGFGLFPLGYTAWVSLHDWQLLGGNQGFVGLGNYTALMSDPRFWIALRNTTSIWVLSTVPQLALALTLAAVLDNRRLRGKGLFRMGLLLPNITSVVAVAIIFGSLFGRDYGLINYTLALVGLDPIDWRAGVASSHIAISTMVIWRWTGYNALILLAGLQAIPRELHEAAAIDGATRFQAFTRVIMPQLRPTLIFIVILSTIGGLQIFAEPLLFGASNNYTGGSSRQFSTVTMFVYEMGFRGFRFGYASAISWMLFCFIAIVSLINFALTRRISNN